MRPSCLAVSLLLLFIIFFSSVQGIRLEASFKSARQPNKLHEGASIQTSSNNGVMGEATVCKQGQLCSSGKSRKLFTAVTSAAPTSTTTLKSQESGDQNKAKPATSKVKSGKEGNGEKQEKLPVGSPTTSGHQEVHDQHADIMDITEMDYSPARRKPPIHN